MGAPDTAANWYAQAACRGTDPEMWFPTLGETAKESPGVRAAKAICGRCPVTHACLVAALREERGLTYATAVHGIRGGLTPRERRAYVRQWQARQSSGSKGRA